MASEVQPSGAPAVNSIWARLPRYAIDDGELPDVRPGDEFACGLGLLAAPPGERHRERQRVRGVVRPVGPFYVVDGPVPAVVFPDTELADEVARRPIETEVELDALVLVEPYLWVPGLLRDACPRGWVTWRVLTVEPADPPGGLGDVVAELRPR
jgi:hypothetical protein